MTEGTSLYIEPPENLKFQPAIYEPLRPDNLFQGPLGSGPWIPDSN